MAPTENPLDVIKEKMRKLEINQDPTNFLEPKFQHLYLTLKTADAKGIASMPYDQFLAYLGVGESKEVATNNIESMCYKQIDRVWAWEDMLLKDQIVWKAQVVEFAKEAMFKIYDEYVDVSKALRVVAEATRKMQERQLKALNQMGADWERIIKEIEDVKRVEDEKDCAQFEGEI